MERRGEGADVLSPRLALRGVGGWGDEQESCDGRGLGLLVDGAGWWGWTGSRRRGTGPWNV